MVPAGEFDNFSWEVRGNFIEVYTKLLRKLAHVKCSKLKVRKLSVYKILNSKVLFQIKLGFHFKFTPNLVRFFGLLNRGPE